MKYVAAIVIIIMAFISCIVIFSSIDLISKGSIDWEGNLPLAIGYGAGIGTGFVIWAPEA